MTINALTARRLVFFDGPTGTQLQAKGLPPGVCPEVWNWEQPEKVIAMHREYIAAGADIIHTNTLGANRLKLLQYGLENRVADICCKAVENARIASRDAGRKIFIAATIGPCGEFLAPLGKLTPGALEQIYREQISALIECRVDIIYFETMIDIAELRSAVLITRELCDLPVFACLAFNEKGRTLTGTDVVSCFNILQGLGVEFTGMNCGVDPVKLFPLMKGIHHHIDAKIIVKANAGIPGKVHNAPLSFEQSARYVEQMIPVVKEGVNIIGSCCGTTPQTLRLLVEKFKDFPPGKGVLPRHPVVRLSSPACTVFIGEKFPFCSIGEKINSTASGKAAAAITAGSIHQVKEIARVQEEKGARVLNINLGLAGTDEAAAFNRIIPELAYATRLPLCFDTVNPAALESALTLYPGRALINSISAEKAQLHQLLSLMKKYGCYAVLLPLDEQGIPSTVAARLKIIETILMQAEAAGIPQNRFMLDVLSITAAAGHFPLNAALETLQTAREHWGLVSTCGLSGISAGLPGKNVLNAALLAMLMGAGLDSAILDVQDELINTITGAGDVLMVRDPGAARYIAQYQKKKQPLYIPGKADAQSTVQRIHDNKEGQENPIFQAIIKGDEAQIVPLLRYAAAEQGAEQVINQYMIPAITYTGTLYEQGVFLLPQLLMSAAAMQKGYRFLAPLLQKGNCPSNNTIIIATVKGDIHDIGKNIVALILENHRFRVFDLGKDVPREKILEKALEEKARVICLSALMTTTMAEMENFMHYMHVKDCHIPVLLGGAVVTEEYAHSIDAHYAKDPIAAVQVIKQILTGATGV